jgi:isoleucyl-tRNA synthetase
MAINYKETLNILKTDFEMKANLSAKEPFIQNEWTISHIYQQMLDKNTNKTQ